MSRREPYSFTSSQDGAKVFWKSLEDKADPASAQKRAESEFPYGVGPTGHESKNLVKLRRAKDQPEAEASIGRRGFMFFAGASAALLAEGCARRPIEKILPYSKAPEQVLPGVPNHFATVRQFRGDAIGMIVESHEGRPTKIEGNPSHPSSLGSTDAFTQAAIFELYDPDRSTTPTRGSRAAAGPVTHAPATWAEFDATLSDVYRSAQADSGAKLRILVEPTNSPTFIRLRDALTARFPQAKIHVWTPVNEGNAREGARIAFGQAVNTVPDYAMAKVIVSLDADFLGTEAGSIRASRGFAEGRKVKTTDSSMSRLYVVEPTFTVTGMSADHRLRLAAKDVERYLLVLAKELSEKHGIDLGAIKDAVGKADATGIPPKWIAAVAKDLAATIAWAASFSESVTAGVRI